MPLPDDFNQWEHLQDTWRKVHNRRVREHFSDLADPAGDWAPDLESARGALRIACTMDDLDTADMTVLRSLLFWMVLGEASSMHPAIYGIPAPSFQEARKFRPQIQLYFQEDFRDIEHGYTPVTGEISFRLMNQSSETLTQSEIHAYAVKVETLFARGGGFQWRKGRTMCSYTDHNLGYQLQLLCFNQTEGRRIIERVLEIQNHAPNWKYLNTSENAEPSERYPITPPQGTIIGKLRRLPRARPVGTVHFRYASLHVWGLQKPICLVDRTGIRSDALIRAL